MVQEKVQCCINFIKKKKETDDEKWIIFDAWKYPERKDLWEGFVLDATGQLNKKLFDDARKRIDGGKWSDLRNLINILSEGINFFIPGSGILKNFTNLFKSYPARRVFEFQEILEKVINRINKDIFVIVEDIDRSGDNGIFFLETLRNFIKENAFNKKVIVIVPIGNDYFEGKKRQSYLKTVDYRINFKISKVIYKKFIEEVFSKKASSLDKFTDQVDYFLRLVSSKKGLTIREIKHILRLSNLRFLKLSSEEQEKIDPRILVLFESLDYIGEQFISIINNKKRFKSDFWGKDYLLMIANNVNEKLFLSGGFKKDLPIFIEGDSYVPIFLKDMFNEGNGGYYLTDKYLNY